jgi:hypothetical protein
MMIRHPALVLLIGMALAGCDQKPRTPSPLVGGWAPPGAACDSPGGVVYDKSGAWAGYNVAGRWKLDGDKLTTWVDERGGYDRPARKVSGEKPSTMTVLSLTPTDLLLRLADGSTQQLNRCRR